MRLKHDTRIHVVAVLVAVGTVGHVLKLVLDQTMVGPMSDYMERWGRVLPLVGWPSAWGIALHVATAAVAVSTLVLRCRRELLALLLVPYVLSIPATPDRISSHSAHLIAALTIVAGMCAVEWIGRIRPGASAEPRPDGYGWTFTGLACVCTSTYWFAAFYKLNPRWFSERSACYLAAGRPVVTQDTGFGTVLPTGEGLFAFATLDEAVAAVEEVERAYERHSRGARAIAEEYFRAETVLARLLQDLGL